MLVIPKDNNQPNKNVTICLYYKGSLGIKAVVTQSCTTIVTLSSMQDMQQRVVQQS